MSRTVLKHARPLIAFFAVLLIFLVTLDIFIVSRQRQEMRKTITARMEKELALAGTFIVEPMLRHDFSRVEHFVRQWGEKHNDIVKFTATAPSGFVIGTYQRESGARHPIFLNLPVNFANTHLLDLQMTRDMAAEEHALTDLHRQLLLRSICMVLTLGIVAWHLFKRLAIKPLEDEIGRRKQAEHELQQARDELEDRVAARTTELEITNRMLEDEILERRQTEAELAAEKEWLTVTLRSIGEGVITTDTAGKVMLLNKIAEQLTGWPQGEAAGLPMEQVLQIIDSKSGKLRPSPVGDILNAGRIISLADDIMLSRDGTERVIAESGAPIRDRESELIGVVVVFRDITEQKKMEEELLKARKLESVGVLAGGIAHDFNNILSGILGNISLASHTLGAEHEIHNLLIEAEKASLRAKDLTRQLLTFSRGGEPIKETACIVEVIKESAEFILHGKNVACDFDFPEDLWLVDIDPGQISQVIQNIILNASESMRNGGAIQVSCENFTNTDRGPLPLALGHFVKISIKDNGEGIPAELLDKIFDPYFTTKAQGNGLGLAITHSIVTKHDGHISVASTPGRGSTFTIFLPASEGECRIARKTAADKPRPLPGRGRIMVMDDEEVVWNVACKMLEHLGFEAVVAKDGREALDLYEKSRQAGQPFDVVIMDLTIPRGMGGGETIGRLLALDPEAKAVVASGYSNDLLMSNYREHGFRAAINKPFRLEELGSTLVKVMEE